MARIPNSFRFVGHSIVSSVAWVWLPPGKEMPRLENGEYQVPAIDLFRTLKEATQAIEVRTAVCRGAEDVDTDAVAVLCVGRSDVRIPLQLIDRKKQQSSD